MPISSPILALALLGSPEPPAPSTDGLERSIVELLYRVEAAPVGWRAINPAQAMCGTFGRRGVRVDGEDWELGLTLGSFGRREGMVQVSPTEPAVRGRRVEFRRGDLTEWYVNEPRGLEQGFTLTAAPPGEGPLVLELSIEGGFRIEVQPGRRDALFTNGRGAVVHYAGLVAWDADGRDLGASLSAHGTRLRIEVDDREALYPLVVDPWVYTETAQLTKPVPGIGSRLGSSVAVSGDTAVVGEKPFFAFSDPGCGPRLRAGPRRSGSLGAGGHARLRRQLGFLRVRGVGRHLR